MLGPLLTTAEKVRKKVQRFSGWRAIRGRESGGSALTRGKGETILFWSLPAVYPVGVSESSSQPVSELLLRWKAGDQQALERLVPLVYKELRDIAHYHLQRERPGHTLQSAALVHEAYLRLLDQKPFDAENRTHFLAVASRQMRQILVDYARSRAATKRAADLKVELNVALAFTRERSADVVALDDALNQLSRLDEEQGRIVVRFFGGLSIEEIGEVLGISRSTVKREWNVAKAWLSRQLKRGSHGEDPAMAKG
jgi:RNA polymerase sigma factor (TIGR02999 family)